MLAWSGQNQLVLLRVLQCCIMPLQCATSCMLRQNKNKQACQLRQGKPPHKQLTTYLALFIFFSISQIAQYHASTINSSQDLSQAHPLVDYTPPSLLTLLFTDLGILTPSAVSDELIKLYL